MNPLSPDQVNALLSAAGPQSSVYLIGVGGCGMSGLGHLLLDLGHGVAGSDLVANEEARQLRARGARIQEGHSPELLAAIQPVLAVYSSAIRLGNAELQAAWQLGIPTVRRAVLLAALLLRQRGICVAGMHGKTTTSSLLAFALEHLGQQPSFAIGALVPQLPRHARYSTACDKPLPFFVVEADESDGTLREFQPQHAIVLNVDEEHLDFYENLEAICREFRRFSDQTQGHLVYCADDPHLATLFCEHPHAVSYGYHPEARYRLEPMKRGNRVTPAPGQSGFRVWRQGELIGEFWLQLMGEKNISNAGAVVALLCELGFDPGAIAQALVPFSGAARRQELLLAGEEFKLYEDYGHHPTEIQATLRALREQGGGKRLLVAFQPHRFTRTRHLLAQFARCFALADRLWLTEVYAASEEAIPGATGASLVEAVRAQGQVVEFVPSFRDLPVAVRAAMEPGDLVLFLGAGTITQAAHQLAAQLRNAMFKEVLLKELTALLSTQSVLRLDEPLAKRTTLRVGGTADLFVEPADETDLGRLLNYCSTRQVPVMILGRGSNLLVRDGGVRGVVVCLNHSSFAQVEVLGQQVYCGAGAKLKTVSVEARRKELGGLEFLEGIPGSVGGALRMNAGAMGGWIFDMVESMRFMDYSGNIFDLPAEEIAVEYRACPILKTHVALSAVFKARLADRQSIEERMAAFNQKRWNSQPAAPSAGCIFKNPSTTLGAGKLIDELGLKGTRVGGAVVSDVHGNFIVNDGKASAQDVLELIEIIRQRVKETRGLELHTEVEIIGENKL